MIAGDWDFNFLPYLFKFLMPSTLLAALSKFIERCHEAVKADIKNVWFLTLFCSNKRPRDPAQYQSIPKERPTPSQSYELESARSTDIITMVVCDFCFGPKTKERNNHNKKEHKKAASFSAENFHVLPRRQQIDKLMIAKSRTKSSKGKMLKRVKLQSCTWGGLGYQLNRFMRNQFIWYAVA